MTKVERGFCNRIYTSCMSSGVLSELYIVIAGGGKRAIQGHVQGTVYRRDSWAVATCGSGSGGRDDPCGVHLTIMLTIVVTGRVFEELEC